MFACILGWAARGAREAVDAGLVGGVAIGGWVGHVLWLLVRRREEGLPGRRLKIGVVISP